MKIFLALTLLIVLGCAEPKYLNEATPNANSQAQENQIGCAIQFKQSKTCLTWSWEKKPTETEVGRLIFKTYRLNTFDQSAVELNLASAPQLVLWMPSMGHGSSPTQTTQLDIGTYRAENIFFVMPGEWDLQFQIQDGDAVIDEAVVHLTI